MGMLGNNMLDGVLARSTSRMRLHWLKGSLSLHESPGEMRRLCGSDLMR